ncbi:MAG: AAA family ATPase [Methyloligellaceae bacterium]
MIEEQMKEEEAIGEVTKAFGREIGVPSIQHVIKTAGNRSFLKIQVGRECPLYTSALFQIQKSLSDDNPFRGALSLEAIKSEESFPNTLEAKALLTLLAKSTREVSEGQESGGFKVPYIPFPNAEDHQLATPATHVIQGRRGVGKSTLIRRAAEILRDASNFVVIIDMQSYSTLIAEELITEVLYDICRELHILSKSDTDIGPKFQEISSDILKDDISLSKVPVAIKRALAELTKKHSNQVYIFLDDFHLITRETQPRLLHYIHNSLKGAGGWLKVAGLNSLLDVYSPQDREGLQIPGDAQTISLDLTLENPEAAEKHLKTILENFLKAIGYSVTQTVMPAKAFKRLAWAAAGVPRDFLQMFARALEHAQRNRHSSVTISDVNIVIGEFGQQKIDDLSRDARNEADRLKSFLTKLEEVCLIEKKVNAFLVRHDDTEAKEKVHALSDLRMIHLIHRSITPDRAGERYEAYIIDYSMFTGFRRRSGIHEMIPEEGQFRVNELRKLPKISVQR